MKRSIEYGEFVIRLTGRVWGVYLGSIRVFESAHLYHCKRAIDTALEHA